MASVQECIITFVSNESCMNLFGLDFFSLWRGLYSEDLDYFGANFSGLGIPYQCA
jgi:hypothetical protein